MICSDKLTADKLCNDLNMRQVRLKFADGIRGLAALWVVLFHASEGGHIEHLKAAAPALLTHIVFDLGHLGVPAFFVLSGFVMMLVAERARFDRYGSLVFLARRMIRLGPPFYVSIVIVLLFLALKHFTTGAPMPSIDWKILLGHITYTQSLFDMPLLNSVYWTLSVEVQFYIAFAMIMLIADRWSTPERRAATRAWSMVVSALVGLPWVFGLVTHPLYPGSFLPFWASFAAGALACLSWRQTGAMRSALWIYVVILATTAAWQSSSFVAVAAFTSGSLALAGQLKRMDVWLKWRWCQFLGLVSYSLYLVHNPITGAGFNVLKRFFPHNALGEAASLIVVVAICLVVSYALYLAVERTSIGWSHKFGKQRE